MISLWLLLGAVAVFCENDIKRKIKEIVGGCTKLVKDHDISGTESFKPSDKEAKERLSELKKLLGIKKIGEEWKRMKKMKEDPELEVLDKKLRSVEYLSMLPKIDAEAYLNHDYNLLQTVVKMSYLDPKNKKSPLFGRKLAALLGLKHHGRLHRKHRRAHRHDNVRLLYSKVIPPGEKVPDATKVFYTDKKGRSCHCMC